MPPRLACAMFMRPEVLMADEPVSALDVSVQRQALDLFAEFQRGTGIAMVSITHDVRVAAKTCDEVAVMFRGEVVETGQTGKVFAKPRHDYTRQLLSAVPGTRMAPAAYQS